MLRLKQTLNSHVKIIVILVHEYINNNFMRVNLSWVKVNLGNKIY